MNPEAGFAPEMEVQETEAPEPRHLADILQLSVEKIRAMTPEELQVLHDEMVPHLSRPDKPSQGFSGYLERLNPALQKQIEKKPELKAQHLQTYVETGLTTLRSRVKIDQQLEKPVMHREMTGADRRFIATVEQLHEKNFASWNASRVVIDRHGRPGHLYPEDQAHVEQIDRKRDIERAKGEDFFELTDRFEYGFAQGLTSFEVFGQEAKVTVHPTSKYDDYGRGVDMIARIQLPGETKQEIVLGIDFTISSSKEQLEEKLLRNIRQPLRKTKYETPNIPRNLEYLPVVLAVDRRRAERVAKHEAITQAIQEVDGGEHVLADSTADIENYHDESVFQYAVLAEAVAQLHVQLEVLEDRGAHESTLLTYRSAITYFEQLLDERKNLQSLAGLEMKQDEGVYIVADESFIRSTPERRSRVVDAAA